MYTSYPMTVNEDRLVSPTMHIPSNAKGASIQIPTLNDAAAFNLQVAPQPHRFNYPAIFGNYANKGILAEWDFDVAATVTYIDDNVNNVRLTEQGDPTPHTSAATPGLGQAMAYDGTGDQHDVLISTLPPALMNHFKNGLDFSVEVVFLGTNASIGALDTVICLRDGFAGIGWAMQFDANQYLDFAIEDSGGETLLTGATDLATDAYVHALVSLDRDGNGVIYANGAADDTTDISSRDGSLFNASADSRLAIGGNAARTGTSLFYGSIAFARIYDRAVSAAEAKDNYNVLMGTGSFPGWSTIAGPVEVGAAQVISKSGSAPNTWVLSPEQVHAIRGQAFRVVALVEQTTSPTELEFGVTYN